MNTQNINNKSSNGSKKVIDAHIHIGGKGNSSPCWMSNKFLKSPAYLYMVIRSGIPLDHIVEDHDGALRNALIDLLNTSQSVDAGVLLAFDAVYKEDGEIDMEKTHMITPNDYVMNLAKTNKKVLFGASINPNRGELEGTKELERCLEGGAVLVKWIPNSQIIDPSDKKYDWFYQRLSDAGIPLLCHTGIEHAVPVEKKEYQLLGNPNKLERALEKGVTVIAAHCSSAGLPWEVNYVKELSEMMKNNDWNLYADISAMCSLFRIMDIDDILEFIPPSRMVMGSDYPVPVETMPHGIVETLELERMSCHVQDQKPHRKKLSAVVGYGISRRRNDKSIRTAPYPRRKILRDGTKLTI